MIYNFNSYVYNGHRIACLAVEKLFQATSEKVLI